MDRDDTLDLANQLQAAFEGSDSAIAATAIVQGNSIGFPLRITDPGEENFDGEPSGFDEAYDFASDLLGSQDLDVDTQGGYVWFENTDSE